MISKLESQALRGIAILGIILHNYCHFLGQAVKENEYKFDAARPVQFWDKLVSLDSDLFIHIFSFLGHYGVPIFLFISGYGLVKKYERGGVKPMSFLWQHFVKLFNLMIVGYLLFIAVWFLRHDDGMTVYSWDRVLAQLTMTVNFVYFEPNSIIKPGPYWYFGLMLQIYALYVFVFHRWRSNALLYVTVLIAFAIQLALGLMDDARWLNFVRYNFIGGMLPFGMGLALARFESKLVKDWVITQSPSLIIIWAINLLLAITFCFMFSSRFDNWLWVPAFIVWGAIPVVKLMPERVLNLFVWLGTISAAIFVTHPLVRKIFVRPYIQDDMYAGLLLYIVATLLMSWIIKQIIDRIPSPKL